MILDKHSLMRLSPGVQFVYQGQDLSYKIVWYLFSTGYLAHLVRICSKRADSVEKRE
jgi:hypothetical protein